MAQTRNQPDHRDLYLLVLGLLVGLLLSEWCLGRLSFETYERMFVGGQEARINKDMAKATLKKKMQKLESDLEQRKQRIIELKSESVMDQFIEQANTERIALAEKHRSEVDRYRLEQEHLVREHATWYQRLLTGLIMVIAVMMILETLLDPDHSDFTTMLQGRFSTVRYAVMAGWLALFLAQPEAFSSHKINLGFFILLLVVAIAAAMAPLGKGKKPSESEAETEKNAGASGPASSDPDSADSAPDQEASS